MQGGIWKETGVGPLSSGNSFPGQTGHYERETHPRVHMGRLSHQAVSSTSLRNEGNVVPVLEAPCPVETNRFNNQCDNA